MKKFTKNAAPLKGVASLDVSFMKTPILLLTFCFFLLLAAMPRIFTLDTYWSSDEALWLNRSKTFMSAIEQGAFSETVIAHHPGVMTMWVAGLRTFFTELDIDVENLTIARWILGMFISIGITVAFLLLNRLFGVWVSLVSVIGLAFSPLFIAQTRRVHTDALATTFILLTVLLFLCYCQKQHHRRYLIFSGVTFGPAFLSKSYSLIILPWIPICLFLFQNANKGTARLKRGMVIILCFLNCSVLTVIIMWPVFWTLPFGILGACLLGTTLALTTELKTETVSLSNPVFWASTLVFGVTCIRTLQTIPVILDKINWAVTTPHNVAHLFLGKVSNDPGWLFYLFVLTINSTPLMLPLAICGTLLAVKHRKHLNVASNQFQMVLALFAIAALFTVCLSATSKKFPRYLLPVFSILDVLAAVGFVEILRWSHLWLNIRFRWLTKGMKTAFIIVICLGGILIEVIPVLAVHPYYGTYYNLCWKVTDITKIITVGDASGLDLAAKHLNEKDNVTQMHIQSSFIAAEFLGYYFPGDIHFAKPLTDTPIQYEVVYIRDVQLGWPPKQGIYNGELEHVITLNDIELVWIYRVEKFEKKQAIAKNLRAEKINKHAAAYERLLLENPATAHAELVKYAQATFGEHRLIEEWIVLYGRLSHQKEAAFPEFIQLLTLAKNMLEDNFPEIAAEAITQLDSSLKSLRSMSKQSSKNFQKLPFRFTLMSLK